MKKYRLSIQQISLAGIMLGLLTVIKLVDKVMPKTPIGASWVELYMVFALILVLTLPFAVSVLVLVTAPFLWFVIGSTWPGASPFSFFLDYSVPILCVLPVYLVKFVKLKGKVKVFSVELSTNIIVRSILIIVLVVFGFSLKWLSHTISGYYSYNTPWGLSASLNAPYVFATMGVALGITIPLLPKLTEVQKLINQKGMKW